MASAKTGIEICEKKLEELRTVAFAKRQKHLTECLKHYREQEHEKSQRNIEQPWTEKRLIESGADSDVPHEFLNHKLHHEWPYKMNMDNE